MGKENLKVLISAYAVSPITGSEPGMAWNWIINLALHCKVFVITEGEWRANLETEVSNLPQGSNITFYYNPVNEKVRRICWNQGDWRFYYYYKNWQKKTLIMAQDIIRSQNIDILHQLNMIGFREPGFLWKINGLPFIWGPIGGMENFPIDYLESALIKQKIFVRLKNQLNIIQSKYSRRVIKAINRADKLIAAVEGVKDKIELYHNKKVVLLSETGCYVNNAETAQDLKEKNFFDVIWVGKFDFRKQLGLALQTIAKVKYLKGLQFHIIGSGSQREISYYKNLAKQTGIEDICIWHGSISNAKVLEIMRKSDLLFFSSIMEGTPHVVLEAIGNNLPVLCFNTCGQAESVNSDVGIKIELTSCNVSVNDFAEKLIYLYENREVLDNMSESCFQRQKELSWQNKASHMLDIYKSVLSYS